MAVSNPTLSVDIWSDVICPWCWIGLTRFEKALEAFEHRAEVAVRHRAFRLMPGAAPRLVDDVVAQRMGIPRSRAPEIFRQVESVAAGEGLTYHLAGTTTGDSLDAHRLIKWAGDRDLSHALLVRLYRAGLSERRSVFDRDSLAALAGDVGLDRDEAQTFLEGCALRDAVEQDQREVERWGATGVPFFLIGGQFPVSGAQPASVFSQALERGWGRLPGQPAPLGDEGLCGPDGCILP